MKSPARPVEDRSVVEPVSVDWKMRGLDFLSFFPERYPALVFLRGEDYETQSDDLARLAVGDVLPPLAAFLAEHGHELWELGTGGDGFDLVIVTAGGGDALRALWMTPDENGYVFCDPVRIGPDKSRQAKGRQRGSPAKKPVDLVAASQAHRDFGKLELERSRFVIALVEGGDDTLPTVLDTLVFPMAPLQSPGVEDLLAEGWYFTPLHASDRHQYFRLGRRRPDIPDLMRLVVMDGASAEPRDLLDTRTDASMRLSDQAWPAGAGDVLFFVVNIEQPVSTDPLDSRPAIHDGGGTGRAFEMRRAQGATIDVVARLGESPQELLALSESRVLAPFGPNHDEIERVCVIDSATGTVGPETTLPALGGCLFALDAEEIVYLHTETRPHPERGDLNESTGYLIRHHLATGHSRRADLDALRTESSVSLRPPLRCFTADREADQTRFMGQAPVKYKIRNFPGFMRAVRGHGTWVILNWVRLKDLAWLWNTATDEVIRIRARDFAREEPDLAYSPALDRYLANHACRLDLLLPFVELQRACAKTQLVWR